MKETNLTTKRHVCSVIFPCKNIILCVKFHQKVWSAEERFYYNHLITWAKNVAKILHLLFRNIFLNSNLWRNQSFPYHHYIEFLFFIFCRFFLNLSNVDFSMKTPGILQKTFVKLQKPIYFFSICSNYWTTKFLSHLHQGY